MGQTKHKLAWLTIALVHALSSQAQAELIINGGFETGLDAWTTVNQVGSEGAFVSQSGTQSPVSLSTVPPPSGGSFAVMTDAAGPGSHMLYQDFVVPTMILPTHILSFSLFVNNGAPDFYTPEHLNFATLDLNQQARSPTA